MTSFDASTLGRVRFATYLFLGLTMIFPIVDLYASLTPIHPGTVMWRFMALGQAASAVATPLLVLLLIYAYALAVGDRLAVILVAVLAGLGALALLMGSGAFALDALQMNAQVPPQGQVKFAMTSGIALTKLFLEGLALLVLAISAVRATLSARRQSVGTTRTPARPVTGRSPMMPPPSQTDVTRGAER